MEKEPRDRGPTERRPPGPDEKPPPFKPDYEIIGLLEGGTPRQLRRFREAIKKHQSDRETSRS